MRDVVFHTEAQAEIDGSAEFYSSRVEGLGFQFLAAVEETVQRIASIPEAGAVLEGAYRKRLVPGFPYTVIYREWNGQIYVLAVAHQHRRPGYWRNRS